MKNKSLFSFGPSINPIYVMDKLFNPYCYSETILLKDKPLLVEWTERAYTALVDNNEPLIIEMQLYFSCVIKKRVIFSHSAQFKTTVVNNKLSIAFHAVEAATCDPVEFAKNFPAKREFDSLASQKMHPRILRFDFKNNAWTGEFYI